MKLRVSAMLAIGSLLAGAACSGPQPAASPAVVPAMREGASAYHILHTFTGGSPAALASLGGVLYGTVGIYGSSGGSLYRITGDGTFRVLHTFKIGSPYSLVALSGKLYGIGGCPSGAAHCSGLLSLDADGNLRLVRAYAGANVNREVLIAANGKLYGIAWGGATRYGAVFSTDASGAYHNLYTFRGGSDGSMPGTLLVANGILYGTTQTGGSSNVGTVFAITQAGSKQTIYNFLGGADGEFPSGLVYSGGTLFGLTALGGTHSCHGNSGPPSLPTCGTFFSLTPGGYKRVLYDFNFSGSSPYALMSGPGVFYGVSGGVVTATGTSTLFTLTPSGTYSVLHAFGGKNDAFYAGIAIDVNGVLYGTGTNPGSYSGIVYRFQP